MADQNDDLRDALEVWLADEDQPLPDEDDFVPIATPDEATVDRMLRRRHRMLTERARVTDVASAEVRRIREWEQDRTAGIDRQMVWLDRGLEMFARQTLPARKIKSLSLPNGVLRLTAPGAPSVAITDEGEFITWALLDDERDRFLRRTVAADKAELKRVLKVGPADETQGDADDATAVFFAVDADGVTVPGLRFTTPAQARFTVTPPRDTGDSPDKETTP